jgi:hypothetical protein
LKRQWSTNLEILSVVFICLCICFCVTWESIYVNSTIVQLSCLINLHVYTI